MAGRKVAQMQEPEQAAENAADMGDMKEEQNGTIMPVSYTHLDVYKRKV